MKKIALNTVYALIFITTFSSCRHHLVPYSDSLRAKYGWEQKDFEKMQFYTSGPVILTRELTKAPDDTIVDGIIKVVDGKKVDRVVINTVTPGKMSYMPSTKKFLISFELTKDHYLSYGENPDDPSLRFTLLAESWKENVGKIHYNKRVYYTDTRSQYTYLLVDLRQYLRLEVSQRVAKGKKFSRKN